MAGAPLPRCFVELAYGPVDDIPLVVLVCRLRGGAHPRAGGAGLLAEGDLERV